MSIDKQSNGMPEVNFHRRTTKVNLGIMIGIGVFFLVGIVVAVWMSTR